MRRDGKTENHRYSESSRCLYISKDSSPFVLRRAKLAHSDNITVKLDHIKQADPLKCADSESKLMIPVYVILLLAI